MGQSTGSHFNVFLDTDETYPVNEQHTAQQRALDGSPTTPTGGDVRFTPRLSVMAVVPSPELRAGHS